MDITKIQGGYSNLGVRGKFSGSSPYILHMLYRNFIRWKQVKILIFLGIRFCVKNYISHGKLFGNIWFQIIVLCRDIKFVEGPFLAHLHIIFALFWQTYDLLQDFKN